MHANENDTAPKAFSVAPESRADRAEPAGILRRSDRWVREHSLLLLVLTMISAFSWPQLAAKVFARGATFHVPGTGWTYDAPSLALSVIILAAAIRCTPADFVRVFRSKAGVANLVTVYVAVPAVTLGIAFATMSLGGADLRAICIGLVLLMIVPVATTSAVWTRSSLGSVPVALSTIAITSLVAVALVPPVLGGLAGASGLEAMSAPLLAKVRFQVVFAFAVPLLVGTSIRSLLPRVATALEPVLSILSIMVLLAFIGDTTAALRPHLSSHDHLLAIALPLTVLVNVLAFAIGYTAARLRGLSNEETIALVFGTGMRSTSTALVVAALCFPASPIVALPPILWSFTQQLLAGVLSRRILHARDRAEPVLPLTRRMVQAAKRASRPTFDDIEALLEDSLVLNPKRAPLPSHPNS